VVVSHFKEAFRIASLTLKSLACVDLPFRNQETTVEENLLIIPKISQEPRMNPGYAAHCAGESRSRHILSSTWHE